MRSSPSALCRHTKHVCRRPRVAWHATVPHAVEGRDQLEPARARRSCATRAGASSLERGARDPPRVWLEGPWETPYGLVRCAQISQALAMAVSAEPESPDDFYDDNAVEVLMPLVKKCWPDAAVAVLGVPPTHDASRLGAHVATLPFKVLKAMCSHPLTDRGNERFLADWASVGTTVEETVGRFLESR